MTGRWRERAIGASISLLAVVLALGLAEGALRAFPRLLPSGAYGAGAYSSELGTNVHSTTLIYNKVRFVEREPNDRGLIDVTHETAKPAGVFRIGFFGDSYVEAAQVRLEDTFFRRLPSQVGGHPVEALAFGMSGWGTLHALRAYEIFAPVYALDAACYVFVENDPGDDDLRIGRFWRQGAVKPLAELSDEPPGYRIHPALDPGHRSLFRAAVKEVQAHSLLAQIVLTRIDLLRTQGLRVRASKGAGDMGASAAAVPNSNDLPSTWPKEDLERVQELTRRILGRWRDEAREQGRYFFVLYVPRGEGQLAGRDRLEDGWRPWLGAVCADLGIPLLDPSEALGARLARGDAVYDDHWTPAGHEVIASEVTRHLGGVLADEAH